MSNVPASLHAQLRAWHWADRILPPTQLSRSQGLKGCSRLLRCLHQLQLLAEAPWHRLLHSSLRCATASCHSAKTNSCHASPSSQACYLIHGIDVCIVFEERFDGSQRACFRCSMKRRPSFVTDTIHRGLVLNQQTQNLHMIYFCCEV